MKVDVVGGEEPELAITGLIHGDEPAGRKAIERIKKNLEFKKPVKFVIANEEAEEANNRFLEDDLNRSFPGDRESESHEEKLAAKVLEEVKNCTVLDIHTTKSYPKPFATIKSLSDESRDILSRTGVDKAVYFPENSGTMTEHVRGVLIEAGHQKSEQAVENAIKVIKNFLASYKAIESDFRISNPSIYKYTEKVEGDWEFEAENFSLVEEGEVYATNGNERLEAEEDFHPVLMSTNGYDGMLGFKAEKIE